MAAAKAIYYNEIGEGKTFDILKKNADGTCDIGLDKTLVAAKVPVSKNGAPGTITLGDEPVSKSESAAPEPPATQ